MKEHTIDPIEISSVTKRYGHSTALAVDDLSLSIHSGEVYGLLGANGAGKTTTIRMIIDVIRPSTGTIRLFGKDVRQYGTIVRKDVGYLPGDVVLPKNVTGHEFLTYLRQLSHNVQADYIQQLVARFEAQLDKKMGQLSKGNRQKIGIIQAFMHQPKVLILDEPTSGLDPLMQEQFYAMIDEARKRGVAILLSSHSFDEVGRMCDRIGILRAGKLVYEGRADQVAASQKPQWRVTLKHQIDRESLVQSPDLNVVEIGVTSVTVEPAATIKKALAALSHYEIVSMTTSQRNLEDEFLHFYDKEAKR